MGIHKEKNSMNNHNGLHASVFVREKRFWIPFIAKEDN